MQTEAFILTGGRSTRMGRDKATLELGGVTLTERMISVARDSSLFSRIRSVGPEAELDAVADTYEGRGPLGGLHAALNAAETEWIFLLGCDLPFVTSDLLTRLSPFRSDEFDAVVPVQADGRLQPLCAFYRVNACLWSVTDLLDQDSGAALKDVFNTVRSRKVAFDEIRDLTASEDIFFNVNTPDDLEKARNKNQPRMHE